MLNKIDSNKTFTDLYGDHLNNVVVFGNPDNTKDFEAHVKMEFWGENYISLHEEGIKGVPTLKDEVVELDLGARKLQWYRGDRPKWGSIHWVEILNEKPASNKWSLKITDSGQFDFCYQTPLAELSAKIPDSRIEYFIQDGKDWIRLVYPDGGPFICDERPLDIDGSIVVKHKTKRNHIIGDKNYRTGKVLHILRPKAVGANNKWVWCDIKTENGFYIRTVPWSLLNDPTAYPIIVNDTFGYSSDPATPTSTSVNYLYAAGVASPAENGNATKLSFYMDNFTVGDPCPATFGLYSDTSDEPDAKVADTGGGNLTVSGWQHQDLDASTPVYSATSYWFGLKWGAATYNARWWHDVGSGKYGYDGNAAYVAGTLPSPFGSYTQSSTMRDYGAYATFTPVAGLSIPAAMRYYRNRRIP